MAPCLTPRSHSTTYQGDLGVRQSQGRLSAVKCHRSGGEGWYGIYCFIWVHTILYPVSPLSILAIIHNSPFPPSSLFKDVEAYILLPSTYKQSPFSKKRKEKINRNEKNGMPQSIHPRNRTKVVVDKSKGSGNKRKIKSRSFGWMMMGTKNV